MDHYLEEGYRIELIEKPDKYSPREKGDRGTIVDIDTDSGSITPSGEDEEKIWIEWDKGGRSALILSVDKYKIVEK